MKVAIIIFSFLYAIGNATYMKWHSDPKLVWVPLAAMILLLLIEVKRSIPEREIYMHVFFGYFVALSLGNLLKQIFYTDKIKQINDYWFGGLLTLGLIIVLWVTKLRRGKK